MNAKLVVLFALVAVSYAAPGGLLAAAPAVYSAPVVHAAAPAVVASNSREIYNSQDALGGSLTGYSVADGLTGDIKASHEERVPGAAVGTNSQLDPNGYIRTTDYVSDAFGTRQVITGSENGLYVNAKDHAIRPNSVAAVEPAAVAPVVAPTLNTYAVADDLVASDISSYSGGLLASGINTYAAAPIVANGGLLPHGINSYAAAPVVANGGLLAHGINSYAAAPVVANGGLLGHGVNGYAAGGLLAPGINTYTAAPIVANGGLLAHGINSYAAAPVVANGGLLAHGVNGYATGGLLAPGLATEIIA